MQTTSRSAAWIPLLIFVAALMLRPLGIQASMVESLAGGARGDRSCCCFPAQTLTVESACCQSSEAPAPVDSNPSGCDCRVQPGLPASPALGLASIASSEVPRLKELTRAARRQVARDCVGLDARTLEGVARAGPCCTRRVCSGHTQCIANPHAGLLSRRGTLVGLADLGIDRS